MVGRVILALGMIISMPAWLNAAHLEIKHCTEILNYLNHTRPAICQKGEGVSYNHEIRQEGDATEGGVLHIASEIFFVDVLKTVDEEFYIRLSIKTVFKWNDSKNV
jgi:hypothetical protein